MDRKVQNRRDESPTHTLIPNRNAPPFTDNQVHYKLTNLCSNLRFSSTLTTTMNHPPRRSERKRRPPVQIIQPSPPKRRKTNRNPDQSSKVPSNRPSANTKSKVVIPPYPENDQTIFLGDDFCTLHRTPPQTTPLNNRKALTLLRDSNYDTHHYFTSVRAGTHAASARLMMYRHVGSILLDKFTLRKGKTAKDRFTQALASEDSVINLGPCLNGARIPDDQLLSVLRSLTRPTRNIWPGPFVILTANHADVNKAFHAKRSAPEDITAQVYISRLLFELIACQDIKVLFEALRPSVPYTPVPKLPDQKQAFTRSPLISEESETSEVHAVSFSSVLRDAESLGYEDLNDEQMQSIEQVVNVKLFPFQRQTVRWMLDMENGPHCLNDFFWERRCFTGTKKKDGGSFYYFPLTGELRLRKPPSLRGGMITEEMGLGKTIEALALIASQRVEHKPSEVNIWCDKKPTDVTDGTGFVFKKRVRHKNSERIVESSEFRHGDKLLGDSLEKGFPKGVKVRRWPAKTTLVVCPKQLIGQWKQEASERAPSLSVELWESDQEIDEDDTNSNEGFNPEFKKESLAVGETARDVIITSYEALRKDHTLSRIFWRRVILDEAQMTRRSTTQIAQDVFNLRAESRFLMTGTPIVNSINDLKGELATLKVWPFTLDNDGFWEHHILNPFIKRHKVPLLDHLLRATMMRHTKGQNLGITLPPRTYETIQVDLVGSHRASYCYVLGSCLDELEAQDSELIDTRRLRIFLRLMVTLCLSPSILDLSSLDLARRFTWSRRPSAVVSRFSFQPGVRPKIRKMSPSEAIEFVAESTSRVVRQTQRSFATGHANVANELDRFLRMTLDQLREVVLSKNIMPAQRVRKLQRERLAALAAGGVHRLATDTLKELRDTAVQVGIAQVTEARKFSRAAVMAKLQQHFDLLNGIEGTRTVHESGFSAITKIMEHKGNPDCPVCLTDCDDRVSVTKCGHIYCVDCVLLMLESSSNSARCAICRRAVSPDHVVEIIRPPKEPKTKENEGALVSIKQGTDKIDDDPEDGKSFLPRGTKIVTEGSQSQSPGETPYDNTSNLAENTSEMAKPTAREAWDEFEQLGSAPSRYDRLGRNPEYPSLQAGFLRHLAAVKDGIEPPKLSALHSLITSSAESSKFCVVAASVQSLGVIYDYLLKKGITCVGAGVPQNQRQSRVDACSEFRENANVRVFLLNPSNSSGLTLIAAEYVIFMETLVRVADEVQAAARVHRIGQSKPVKIVRIVARNTIEELMVRQRGEIGSPQEESRVLSAVSTRDASDRLILDLLRDER